MKFMLIKQTSFMLRSLRAFASICALLAVMSACVTGNNGVSSANSSSPLSDKANIHTQLARGYMKQKQYAVAKDELDKALAINPNHSDSHYVRGLLMLDLKQYDEAESSFRRAVELDSTNASAAHDFGVFLCQTGKEAKSVRYFDIAVANPFFEKPELSNMRAGECLARIGQVERAERYLKKALAVNGRLRPALYRLSVLKFNAGSFFSARAYIERYLAITKPQPAALLLAYQIESELNAKDIADKYRMTILEDFPGSNEARVLRNRFKKQ